MLRRALLLACLLAPLAVRAQTASITFGQPDTFGTADCILPANLPSADDPLISLDWQVVIPSGTTPTNAWTYVVKALPPSGNCTSDVSTTNVVNQNPILYSITATAGTGSFPGSSGETPHLSDFMAKAGLSCSATSDQVITVCVQLLNGGSATNVSASVSKTITVQLAKPGAPTGVAVSPGDSALNVSWTAPAGTPKADTYRVVASTLSATCASPPPTPLTADCVGALVTQSTTTATSRRITGLTNGTTYAVQVFAISVGGNESVASSPPVAGTPAVVQDFWDQYGGVEQGGCGGGPAGLVSLLAVAGLMATLRRRS